MKAFLAWHVILIQINNRLCDCNKGEHNTGVVLIRLESAKVDQIVFVVMHGFITS